jgi:hypothetical protein
MVWFPTLIRVAVKVHVATSWISLEVIVFE